MNEKKTLGDTGTAQRYVWQNRLATHRQIRRAAHARTAIDGELWKARAVRGETIWQVANGRGSPKKIDLIFRGDVLEVKQQFFDRGSEQWLELGSRTATVRPDATSIQRMIEWSLVEGSR